MQKKYAHLRFIVLIGFGLFFVLGVSWQWSVTVSEQEGLFVTSLAMQSPAIRIRRAKKPAQQTVKALYLTASSAANEKKMNAIIDLIGRTELNAVVIDIKDYSGWILYDSNLVLVNEFKTDKNILGDVRALIQKLHEKNIYVIARQTVFQDPLLAERKPEWALKNKKGSLWRDYKGLAWVNPAEESVWRYNLAIAREAVRFGFDEINFDYVRFPSDGDMSAVVFENGGREKHDVMRDFFQFIGRDVALQRLYVSIDVFGFAMERNDGMGIGQRIADAVDSVDYIAPMMYPSHYPAGHLGFSNPAEHPTEVIENGMKRCVETLHCNVSTIRPWIQAFNLGAVYDAGKIRAEIDAVEKYTDAGWMLWNAANRYSEAGLLVEQRG